MAAPTSTALTKRAADSALMPPPPPLKRQKRPKNVLDEDVYADALSQIIARDFFPGLLETEAQQEYLAALDSNNNEWIREAGRRLTQVMTPGPGTRRRGTSFTPQWSSVGDTPRGYVGATPGRTPAAGGTSADDFAPEKPEVDINMSLEAFQAKYTSEDNESFNQLLDKQNERRQGKYAFFHQGNKIPSFRQLVQRQQGQELVKRSQENGGSTALVRTNGQGEERQIVAGGGPSQDLDARPASVDSFPNRQGPRNSFMFGPDSIEDSHVTRAQDLQTRANAPPRGVAYDATRFRPVAAAREEPVPPSPSLSAIDGAIAGRPRPTASESGYSGAETPRVNGYAFVDAEPTPEERGMPVSEEEADRVERETAMKFLPKAEAEGGSNPFSIRERSAREELGLRALERVERVRKEERGGGGIARGGRLGELGVTPGGRTTTPGARSAQKGGMTPAAQRLAEKLRTPGRSPKERAVFGGGSGRGRVDWTPTPRVKRPG